MAALSFPAAPTTGQKYPDPAVAGSHQWEWSGSEWTLVAAAPPASSVPDPDDSSKAAQFTVTGSISDAGTAVTVGGKNYKVWEWHGNGTIVTTKAGYVLALCVGAGGNGQGPTGPSGGGGGAVREETLWLPAGTHNVVVGAGFGAGLAQPSYIGSLLFAPGGDAPSNSGGCYGNGSGGAGGTGATVSLPFDPRDFAGGVAHMENLGSGPRSTGNGGGGGAGGVGLPGANLVGGNGGPGKSTTFFGAARIFSCGGGGTANQYSGASGGITPGQGGRGDGSGRGSTTGANSITGVTPVAANTGDGAGAGGENATGGASGIVGIRIAV